MHTLDRFRLDNKVAIITGGNRGLGREMARAHGRMWARRSPLSAAAQNVHQAAAADIAGEYRRATCRGYECDVVDARPSDRTC